MIYKVQLDEFTYTEVECYNYLDKCISFNVSQGFYEKDLSDVKYDTFTNFVLTQETCQELIKSLQLALTDSH